MRERTRQYSVGEEEGIMVETYEDALIYGAFGYSPDSTPRDNYSVSGVTSGAETPETTPPEGGTEPPPEELGPPPELDSLDPATAEQGGADVVMRCLGSGFVGGSQIVFNGGIELTEFVSDTELTTTVRPSTVQVPGAYEVYVINPDDQTTEGLNFTFTPAPPPGGVGRRGR